MRQPPVAPNSPLGKSILARIRGVDHAHAGEEEAIALTFEGVARDPDRRVLDVGSGRGGTADWVHRHGFGRVTGIDLDAESVAYAAERYPDCDFVACDVVDLPRVVPGGFGLVYALNAFYAFSDLRGALAAVRAVAAPAARLRIFDYVRDDSSPPVEGARATHAALGREALGDALRATGWRPEGEVDLTADYVRWYEGLLDNLAAKRAELDADFGAEVVGGLAAFYADLLAAVRSGEVGGAVVSATAA